MKDHQIRPWGNNFAIVARTERTDNGPSRWAVVSKHDNRQEAEVAMTQHINDTTYK